MKRAGQEEVALPDSAEQEMASGTLLEDDMWCPSEVQTTWIWR